MLILIRCDGTSSRIILFYYYEITSLPLLRCIKQVKSGNIKKSVSRQEKGLKPYTLRHKHNPSSSPPTSTFFSPYSSLSSSKLINTFINDFCNIKIPRTDLIFEGFPINTHRSLKRTLCRYLFKKRFTPPWRNPLKKSQYSIEVKVVEHIVNDVQGSLGIIHSRIFSVIFVSSSLWIKCISVFSHGL